MEDKIYIIQTNTRIQSIVLITAFLLFGGLIALVTKCKTDAMIIVGIFIFFMILMCIKEVFKPKYYSMYILGEFLHWDTPDEQEKIAINDIEYIDLGGSSMPFGPVSPDSGHKMSLSTLGGTIILKDGGDIIMPSVIAKCLSTKKCRAKLEKFSKIEIDLTISKRIT
jgi:uncharacterized membrane protein